MPSPARPTPGPSFPGPSCPGPSGPEPGPAPGLAADPLRRRRLLPAPRNPHDAEILRLAVPAFGALVAEPLFLFADSVIVGRLGIAPLGGLGVASQALTALVGISIFLAYGTTAAVARQLGAGHREAAIRQGIDGLWLAGIIGAAVLALGWPVAPQIVHAFGGSPAVSGQAAMYLRSPRRWSSRSTRAWSRCGWPSACGWRPVSSPSPCGPGPPSGWSPARSDADSCLMSHFDPEHPIGHPRNGCILAHPEAKGNGKAEF
jgi:hypothetical protein